MLCGCKIELHYPFFFHYSTIFVQKINPFHNIHSFFFLLPPFIFSTPPHVNQLSRDDILMYIFHSIEYMLFPSSVLSWFNISVILMMNSRGASCMFNIFRCGGRQGEGTVGMLKKTRDLLCFCFCFWFWHKLDMAECKIIKVTPN